MRHETSERAVLSRLDLCRDLLAHFEAANAARAQHRLAIEVLERSATDSIRRELKGLAAAHDVFMTPRAGHDRLRSALEAAAGKPAAEQLRVARRVLGIAHSMAAIARARDRLAEGVPIDILQAVSAGAGGDAHMIGNPKDDVVIDDMIGAGAFGQPLRAELADALARANAPGPAATHLREVEKKYAVVLADYEERVAAVSRFVAATKASPHKSAAAD
jgi:hypothetical protein